MATGIGRLGAILVPLLIGFIVALNLPIAQNFMVISLAGLIGAIALSLINHQRSDAAIHATMYDVDKTNDSCLANQ